MATDQAAAADLESRVTAFLQANLPQIALHGGDASVVELDPDVGRVTLRLSGACSGCGISPMTIQAIKTRLPAEIAEITEVVAETGPPVSTDAGADADGSQAASHHGMGGHPAAGSMNLDFEGEIPEWRRKD